jgi:nucleotide-binding universal stress UspA family protein
MCNLLKIMIVYDGSKGAENTLEDIRYAGLPSGAEVKIVTMVEPIIPAGLFDLAWNITLVRESQSRVQQARFRLRRGCARLERIFPDWEVDTSVCEWAREFGIVRLAAEWQPDLIVINPVDRSRFESLVLGDAARSVIKGASCSVRVARAANPRSRKGLRLLIGFDGSRGAAATICQVWARHWPPGTQAHLVAAFKPSVLLRSVSKFERKQYLDQVLNIAAETLRTAGLNVTTALIDGSPEQVILDEARKWEADSIFLGRNNRSNLGRLFSGSTSAAVASQAHCSVEVVRESKSDLLLSATTTRSVRQKQLGYAVGSS